MDKIKANKAFFGTMVVLVIALIGSAYSYMLEKGKLIEAQNIQDEKQGEYDTLLRSDPTEEHVKMLEAVRLDVEDTYQEILKTLSNWNDYATEAIGTSEILACCRDEIGYKEIEESAIRKWIDDEKLKSFQAPDGRYFVLREDFEDFLAEVRKSRPGQYFPEDFVEGAISSTTKLHLSETPTLFLGNLQKLQREITTFARKKDVPLKEQVELLSFPKLLGGNKPPTGALLPLIKQRSAVRDIMYLLIQSGVFEIQGIAMTKGRDSDTTKTSFFSVHDFEVTFVATYPAIGRFMNMLLSPQKEYITVSGGAKEALPRNFFVITDILYKSEEAELETERQEEYENQKAIEERARREMSPASYASYRRRKPSTATSYTPKADSEYNKYYKKINAQYEKTKEMAGRRPKHKVLKVVMKISFVDLTGEITGEKPRN